MKETFDAIIEGYKLVVKECPNSENMTFEEIANWAGQHCLITERDPNDKMEA